VGIVRSRRHTDSGFFFLENTTDSWGNTTDSWYDWYYCP